MRLRPIAIIAAIVGLLAGTVSVSASSPKFNPPKHFYLSLGDSLAFGFQQAKFNTLFPNENPAAFNTGYTDDFSALLRSVTDNVQTINFGCPGETTDSFMNGPCAYASAFPLHDAHTEGSQLATAVNFLKANPGQVSPITIDIGSNDVLAVLASCAIPPITISGLQCVVPQLPDLSARISAHLKSIIATLHAASPSSEIIVLNLYNPLVVSDSAIDGFASDGFAASLDAAIANAATAEGARVADVFSTINPGALTNPGNATELVSVCSLTAICTSLHDTHPTDAGYAAMAATVWQASGYSRLGD